MKHSILRTISRSLTPFTLVMVMTIHSSELLSQVCNPGYFYNLLTSLCEECSEGTFQSNAGQTSCIDCPAGTYSNAPGLQSCIPCEKGTYQEFVGSVSCIPCEEGFYQNDLGAISCEECPSGYISPKGSTSSSDCVLANQPGSVDITGKATVGFMLRTNDAEDIVVRRPDGTLGYRELSTMMDDDGDSKNEKITGFGIIGDSLYIKEGSMDTMKVGIAKKSYVDVLETKLANLRNVLFDAGLINYVEDIDGNKYDTIKIGDQIWMAENLRTTRYSDGSAITYAESDGAWAALTAGGYSFYDTIGTGYSTYSRETFGALYNWYAVDDSRGLCPSGWHVPSDDVAGGDSEWQTSGDYLGGALDAGKKMKTISGWYYDNESAAIGDNTSGFSGLPGGYRKTDGTFKNIGSFGYWWSSTEDETASAWYRLLLYNDDLLGRDPRSKGSGMSIRCLRD